MPPGRIAGRRPDAVFDVMPAGGGGAPAVRARGRTVTAIRLCEYVEREDGPRGPYSLITAVVETDAGTAELVYDEGHRGRDALGEAGRFLVGHLGASALVERAVAEIDMRGGGAGRQERRGPPNG